MNIFNKKGSKSSRSGSSRSPSPLTRGSPTPSSPSRKETAPNGENRGRKEEEKRRTHENGRSTSNAIDIDDDDGGTLQLREAANIVPVTPSPLVLPLSPPSHPLSSSSPESPTILISMSEKLHRKPHPHKLDLRKLSIPSSPSLDCITNNGDAGSPIHRPNSPLLSALREAVESVSNMDDFEQIEKIGSGFFAEVYKVCHKITNEIMVLKVNKGLTGTKTRQEVELLKRLHHPNILHYIGSCIHNGQLHPLTEFVNGGTLKDLIQDTSNPFPSEQRIQLSLDMALGMEYLHNNGMLHRDFNSHNCLLRKEGDRYTAVVADFGLATKNPNLIKKLRRNQSVVGTPYWMAPEVLHGNQYDESADVYSFGIVLCEIVSRKDADPDEIPRNPDNYSLDEGKFRALPEVRSSPCPPYFIDLACTCSRFLPIERPGFPTIVTKLLLTQGGRTSRTGSLPPRPYKRLSWQGHAVAEQIANDKTEGHVTTCHAHQDKTPETRTRD